MKYFPRVSLFTENTILASLLLGSSNSSIDGKSLSGVNEINKYKDKKTKIGNAQTNETINHLFLFDSSINGPLPIFFFTVSNYSKLHHSESSILKPTSITSSKDTSLIA